MRLLPAFFAGWMALSLSLAETAATPPWKQWYQQEKTGVVLRSQPLCKLPQPAPTNTQIFLPGRPQPWASVFEGFVLIAIPHTKS